MCPQIACPNMQSHVSSIFFTFLHCAFSNVSSNSLDLNRKSHIGCICLNFSTVRFQMWPQIACQNICKVTSVAFFTFLQCWLCVFKCFLKKLGSKQEKSHWLHLFEFFHCAFSDVSSNCLHKHMQCHIGSIFFTFLRCAFSNVSSNSLYLNRQSHIGCIFTNFSTVHFQMCPQIVCPNIFLLFCNVRFQMFPQIAWI